MSPGGAQTPEKQLARFMSAYEPGIQTIAKQAITRMQALMPGATRLVYDNYNALVIAFSPSTRTSDCLFSVALYPRWVSVFFARGAEIPDPEKLLKGTGKTFRHIVLKSAKDLDLPAVRTLIRTGLAGRPAMVDPSEPGGLLIKSISPKQRPRQPPSKPVSKLPRKSPVRPARS